MNINQSNKKPTQSETQKKSKSKVASNDAITFFNILKSNLILLNFPFSSKFPISKFSIEIFYNTITSNTSQSSLVQLKSIYYQILHFLLTSVKFRENDFSKEFLFCFPVTTLIEAKEFKEKSFSILKKLEKDGILLENSILSMTLLDCPIEDKGISLLSFLSISNMEMRLDKPYLTMKTCINSNFINDDDYNISNSNIFNTYHSKNSLYENVLSTHNTILHDNLISTIEKIGKLQVDTIKEIEYIEKEKEEVEIEINESSNKVKYYIKKGVLKDEDGLSGVNRMMKIENFEMFIKNINDIEYKLNRVNQCNNVSDTLYNDSTRKCIESIGNIRHMSINQKIFDYMNRVVFDTRKEKGSSMSITDTSSQVEAGNERLESIIKRMYEYNLETNNTNSDDNINNNDNICVVHEEMRIFFEKVLNLFGDFNIKDKETYKKETEGLNRIISYIDS